MRCNEWMRLGLGNAGRRRRGQLMSSPPHLPPLPLIAPAVNKALLGPHIPLILHHISTAPFPDPQHGPAPAPAPHIPSIPPIPSIPSSRACPVPGPGGKPSPAVAKVNYEALTGDMATSDVSCYWVLGTHSS